MWRRAVDAAIAYLLRPADYTAGQTALTCAAYAGALCRQTHCADALKLAACLAWVASKLQRPWLHLRRYRSNLRLGKQLGPCHPPTGCRQLTKRHCCAAHPLRMAVAAASSDSHRW